MKCLIAGGMLILAVVSFARADNPYGLPDGLYAEIKTDRGTVVGELYYKKVPLTVANYVGLAEGTLGPRKGTPFFDGARIVRVDFVIETGETRQRIPGFADEMVPGLRHDSMGVMEMANDGPDTNGTYWCFMMEESERLNYLHTVFGKVVKGMDVLPQVKVNDTIQTLRILRVGAEAKKFVVTEESFEAMAAKAKKYDGPKEPGPEAFFDDADKVLPQPGGTSGGGRYNRAKDFNFKLGNFHLFTGKTVKVRVFAKWPAEFEDAGLMKAYMEALATKLGMEKEGALAVYFADKDRWEIWIGAESQASFMAGPRKADGSKAAVAEGKTLEQAMGEFLAESRKEGDALIAKEIKEAPAGQTVAEGQKVKLKVDAVVDGLIFRLE